MDRGSNVERAVSKGAKTVKEHPLNLNEFEIFRCKMNSISGNESLQM